VVVAVGLLTLHVLLVQAVLVLVALVELLPLLIEAGVAVVVQ
jgi:hypothetical protein